MTTPTEREIENCGEGDCRNGLLIKELQAEIERLREIAGQGLQIEHRLRKELLTAIAAERERCALWMLQHSYATGPGDTIEDLLIELEGQIKENERKRCARFVEENFKGARSIAAAIRGDKDE